LNPNLGIKTRPVGIFPIDKIYLEDTFKTDKRSRLNIIYNTEAIAFSDRLGKTHIPPIVGAGLGITYPIEPESWNQNPPCQDLPYRPNLPQKYIQN